VQLALCDAYFGPRPRVKLGTPSLNADDTRFIVDVEYGNHWAGNSGLGVELVWVLKQVLLDGNTVKLSNFQKHFGRQATMVVESGLTPGDHTMEMQFDCAYVDSSLVSGADTNTLTPDQCPKTRRRWLATVTVPVKVAPSADSQSGESDE
jgi:hypothetical protein